MNNKFFGTLAALSCVGSAFAATTTLYDNSNGNLIASSATAAGTMLGGVYQLATAGATTITDLTFNPAFKAAATYTNVQLRFSVWGTVTGATGASPAFSNLLGYFTRDLGAQTFTGATNLTYTASGLNILTTSNIIAVELQTVVDTGSGLNISTNAVQCVRNFTGSNSPAVGSNPLTGNSNRGYYFGNVSAQPNPSTSFLASDGSSGPNGARLMNMALKVGYTPVPEPASMLVLGLGAVALVIRQKRK